MKKRKLLLVGIFLSFLHFSCSDELDYAPRPAAQGLLKNFELADARTYFEENATDLAPLRFTEQMKTKSSDLPELELTPEWHKAMESGHRAVRLYEIPIRSNSINMLTERVVKGGKTVYRKSSLSQRRLVIARRSNGETDMFIITLSPLPTYRGNVQKSLDNFRYLGGGDFTGRVFCSTLDGKFVKAFGYTNGHLNGTLIVMKRSDLVKHTGEDFADNYSAIQLHEGIMTRAGTYMFDEGGGTGTQPCPHGNPDDGSCPLCLDEAIVTYCPYCHTQNGCVCSRCFYCGEKEARCTCSRCPRCGRKTSACTCYMYPDPDPQPGPNPGSGGGGGGSIGGGGSTGNQSSPTGELAKAIFSKTSLLSHAQWAKVEKALEKMNKDCAGGRLIGLIKSKNINIALDENMSLLGRYNHGTNTLTIQDFDEFNLQNTDLERTLYHELLHSVQTHNTNAKLNLEIEVYVEVYRYALRNKVSLNNDKYKIIGCLSDVMDQNYKIVDQESYNDLYSIIINELRKAKEYQNYSETSSARNFNKVKELSKDC